MPCQWYFGGDTSLILCSNYYINALEAPQITRALCRPPRIFYKTLEHSIGRDMPWV